MKTKLKSNYQLGIIYIISSAFCFALMNLFIRLSGDLPTMQKCFFRNFFALIVSIITLAKAKVHFKWGKGNFKYLLGRSIAGCVGMIFNFYAIDNLAISDAAILNKLSPFAAILFSIILIKEKPNVIEWLSVIVAFIGALFVIKPTGGMGSMAAIIGVLGGIGAGLAYAFVRKLGIRGEKGMIIVAFFSGFTTIVMTPNLIINYVPMTMMQTIFLILTGIVAAGGQICITKAYTFAAAKEISVYDFTIVLFTAIFGFIFLDQIPDKLSIVGYVIIIGVAILKWRLGMRDSYRKEK